MGPGPLPTPGPGALPAGFALVDVGVVDGDGSRSEHRTVLLADGRIREIGAAASLTPPANVPAWHRPGSFVLPGFIDAHVHLGLADPVAVVRGGVTYVRDLGWPPAALHELRDHPGDDPAVPGIAVAGQILTVPGGYPTRAAWAPPGTGRPVRGTAEARAVVAEMAALGAVVIKVALEPRVGPTLPIELLDEIVRAAAARNLPVGAHVAGTAELAKALDAGVAELVHWPFFDAVPPEPLIREVAAAMTVVPTLHIEPSAARRTSLATFLTAGGRVVYGTDLGNEGPPPGIDLDELELLRAAGLDPARLIAAATGSAATHLRLPERGRVAAGFVADLIVVDADPFRDLAALTRPLLVFRAGRPVPGLSAAGPEQVSGGAR